MQAQSLLLYLMQCQNSAKQQQGSSTAPTKPQATQPLHLSVHLELLPVAARWLLQHPDVCGPFLAGAAAVDSLQEIEVPLQIAAICDDFRAASNEDGTSSSSNNRLDLQVTDDLLVQFVHVAVLPLLSSPLYKVVQVGLAALQQLLSPPVLEAWVAAAAAAKPCSYTSAAAAAAAAGSEKPSEWPGQAAVRAAARTAALGALLPAVAAKAVDVSLQMPTTAAVTREGAACRQLACDVINSMLGNGPLLAAAGRSSGQAAAAAADGGDAGQLLSTAGVQLLQPQLHRLLSGLICTAVQGLSQLPSACATATTGASGAAGGGSDPGAAVVAAAEAGAVHAAACGSAVALEALCRLLEPLAHEVDTQWTGELAAAAREAFFQLAVGQCSVVDDVIGRGTAGTAAATSAGAAASTAQQGGSGVSPAGVRTASVDAFKGLGPGDIAAAVEQGQAMLSASQQWQVVCRLRAQALLDAATEGWQMACQQQQGIVSPAAWVVWSWVADACGLLACAATDWRDAAAVQQLMQQWVLRHHHAVPPVGPGATAAAAGLAGTSRGSGQVSAEGVGGCCGVPLLPEQFHRFWKLLTVKLCWPLWHPW